MPGSESHAALMRLSSVPARMATTWPLLSLLLLAGCSSSSSTSTPASTSTGSSQSTPAATATPVATAAPTATSSPVSSRPTAVASSPVATATGGGTGQRGGKLSPRLQQMADLAAAGTLASDPAGQNRQLGLPQSGGGSLGRDDAGRPLVEARVADTSAATLADLTAHGANIVSISGQTVSLGIDPKRLTELANLASVLSVQEALAPETGR